MPIALILICLALPLPGFAAAQTGSPAPSFVLKDIAGSSIKSSDFQGKVLLVSFWAPWCTTCREELRALEALYAKYRPDGFEAVAISVDPSEKAVSAFVREAQLSYPVLLDQKKKTADEYQCSHLPTTVIIGKDGIIRRVVKGFGKDHIRNYERIIVELLK